MNKDEFLNNIDYLLKNHKVSEAKNLYEEELKNAIIKKDNTMIIIILNEYIGFLRDSFMLDECYIFASRLYQIIKNEILNIDGMISSLINIGNAYRASNHLDEATKVFNEAKELFLNYKNDTLEASLYNNMALLYDALKNYNLEIELLNKAVLLINDEKKLNTSYLNLAIAYFKLNDLNNTKKYIEKVKDFYETNLDDFHIQGYFSLLARFYHTSDLEKSKLYYEKAIASIHKFCGKTDYYYEILNEYFKVFNISNKHIKGMDLSYNYYLSVKDEFFNNIPKRLHDTITIGLFGLGSECYFLDDFISEDHDFNPDFIILVSDFVSKEDFNLILNSYLKLPKEFDRFYIEPLDKKGVHYESSYLKQFLGVESKELSIDSKSLITNGRLFYCGKMSHFKNYRDNIIIDSREDMLIDLIKESLKIFQYLPYNLNRALERKEEETYLLLKNHLVDHIIKLYFIIKREFIPHDKLWIKMMDKNHYLYKVMNRVLKNDLNGLYEEFSNYVLTILNDFNFINKDSIYFDEYRFDLIDQIEILKNKKDLVKKIVDLEWDSFKSLENIGGVASCQLNPKYFYLMRKSQFYTWDLELLNSYLFDLELAKKNSYNLLWIKYAFMEETVDRKHFELIKDRLPKITKKRMDLLNEIVNILLNMKEEFNKENPEDKINMRNDFKAYDNESNASYETYLKGELLSYSEKTMYLFARMLVKYVKENKNLVKLTIHYTKWFHSVESL